MTNDENLAVWLSDDGLIEISITSDTRTGLVRLGSKVMFELPGGLVAMETLHKALGEAIASLREVSS